LKNITISIVSHNQGRIMTQLLDRLAKYSTYIKKVIVTHNITESKYSLDNKFPFEVFEIQNKTPKGFASNHNQAFRFCDSDFFCVMNPDIDIVSEPFHALQDCFQDTSVAIVAPLIKNAEGQVEDTARYFPTPFGLAKKLLLKQSGTFNAGSKEVIIYPDWLGGMFLLFESKKYTNLNGFDESFHLYYEDVDICLRAWKYGFKVLLCKDNEVIHDARRSSHSDLVYMKWHLTSLLRFFIKHFGRFPNKVI
jgi:N-acetylglucosaminyl-diphospho-decaprenol L-rhamnosyltransferase